ncbi:hypothetical protein PR202_ga25511 [Eleusine coracana subsp. coracana]|uniref:Uncharacterized protein n=1 Tax=Eleusine coracana subsp. coracana TaxID=191504 RepID=A0AAV5DAS8_ELECO|nr:hypothetical protein PR202_ga25450 [Eleusine coracana subsp. coracana]GJN07665.1 hypothetical protein PR202_ga25511 [Eleusine coracana subsp. coracana]
MLFMEEEEDGSGAGLIGRRGRSAPDLGGGCGRSLMGVGAALDPELGNPPRGVGSPMGIDATHGVSVVAAAPLASVVKKMNLTLSGKKMVNFKDMPMTTRIMLGGYLYEKIVEVLDMTVAYGTYEGFVKHFMTTLLFKSAKNRSTFKALKANERRLAWLKRHFVKEGLV